jgi:glucosamine 6-phosphate synthetase-like amidotransferase/phosphosugar isomerase protein
LLDALFNDMSAALPALEAQTRDLVSRYGQAERVFILGSGSNLGTAKYGAAKFAELTRTPAVAQDMEEFAHAEYWQLQKQDLVVILAEPGEQRAYAANTVKALAEFGVNLIAVAVPGAESLLAETILVPETAREWSPLPLSLPLQLLPYFWAIASGLDPNRRPHLKEDQARFEVSRKLTRRALVGKGV